jgi:phosphatidylglycerol:prolipoprotein diacylglycerol transferase
VTVGEVFTAAGYALGAGVFLAEARRRKLATEGILWLLGSGFFFGVVGAKVSQWLAQGWPASRPVFAIFSPEEGGRALAGGLIIGWLAVSISKRILGIRRSTGDLFALALPAGEAVGRIGCYFNGCCYGTPTHVSWAVYQHSQWRHPAQLYSSVSAALLFGILVLLRDRLAKEGDLFRLYLVGFGASRFALEFFREGDKGYAGLSLMQWACIGFVVYGFGSLVSRMDLLPVGFRRAGKTAG